MHGGGARVEMAEPLLETNLTDVPLLNRGKVRDIYDLGDQLLIVATDRISAFDVVMPNGIPDKGRVLTQMSLFWFELTADIVENHVIRADATEYPAFIGKYMEVLAGRSMLVKRAEVVPVECVVRGYLAGSGWREYRENGTVCGIELPVMVDCHICTWVEAQAVEMSRDPGVNLTFDECRIWIYQNWIA